MKLGHSDHRLLSPGDVIRTKRGLKYRIVRVSGSTVTADRIPTAVEAIARTLGLVAGVIRTSYRRARAVAKLRGQGRT